MSKKNIAIVDYGLGNLLSVSNAFKYLGTDSFVTDSPDKLKNADAAILPGVGAFADGMSGLEKRNLIGPVAEFIQSGRPLLGICLGAQLLMTTSFEFGRHQGLNCLEGEVVPFNNGKNEGASSVKVPHIGWNSIMPKKQQWHETILAGLNAGQEMYFVHSFFLVPKNDSQVLAETRYGSQTFCSVIRRGNLYGCQFHPEKSSTFGLKILDNFVRLVK